MEKRAESQERDETLDLIIVPSVYRIYAQNEREHKNTHTWLC